MYQLLKDFPNKGMFCNWLMFEQSLSPSGPDYTGSTTHVYDLGAHMNHMLFVNAYRCTEPKVRRESLLKVAEHIEQK